MTTLCGISCKQNHWIDPGGIIDKRMSFDEYISDENIKALKEKMYPEIVAAWFLQ